MPVFGVLMPRREAIRRARIWRVRRARLSVILSVAATAATLHAQGLSNPSISSDLNRRGASVDRLHVWVESIRQRDSGNTDDAVARVAQWTSAQLDDLWIELQSLHELMENPRHSNAFRSGSTARAEDSPRGSRTPGPSSIAFVVWRCRSAAATPGRSRHRTTIDRCVPRATGC